MRPRIESDAYVGRPSYPDPTPGIAIDNIQGEVYRPRTSSAIGEKGIAHTFHEAFRQLWELRKVGSITKKDFNARREQLRQYRDVALETVVNFKGTGGIK